MRSLYAILEKDLEDDFDNSQSTTGCLLRRESRLSTCRTVEQDCGGSESDL